MTKPFIEINWEESDVCLYINCECGKKHHWDIPNISEVYCSSCQRTYKLPKVLGLENG